MAPSPESHTTTAAQLRLHGPDTLPILPTTAWQEPMEGWARLATARVGMRRRWKLWNGKNRTSLTAPPSLEAGPNLPLHLFRSVLTRALCAAPTPSHVTFRRNNHKVRKCLKVDNGLAAPNWIHILHVTSHRMQRHSCNNCASGGRKETGHVIGKANMAATHGMALSPCQVRTGRGDQEGLSQTLYIPP